MSDRPVWFSPKRTGIGIRPAHPVGWLITALFVAVFIISLNLFFSASPAWAVVLLILDIVIYVAIVFATKS